MSNINLKYQEQEILCTFAVLPEKQISVKELYDIFHVEETCEVEFFDTVHDLASKGWLTRIKGEYKIDTANKNIVKSEIQPDATKCSEIIEYLTNKISDYKEKQDFDITIYTPLIDTIFAELSDKTISLANLANNYAVYLNNSNSIPKAIVYLNKAIEIQKYIDDTNPDLAFYYNNLAVAYRSIGDYKKSLSCSYSSIDISKRSNSKNDQFLVSTYNIISNTYNKIKNYPKAVEFGLKAISIGETIYEKDHIKLASLYYETALTFYNSINLKKSIYFIDQAVEIFKSKLPANHPLLKLSIRNQKTVHLLYRFEIFIFKNKKIFLTSLAFFTFSLLSLLIYIIFF